MGRIVTLDPLVVPAYSPWLNATTVDPRFQGLWKGLIAGGTIYSRPLRNIVTGDKATATSFARVPSLGGGRRPSGLIHETDATLTGSSLPAVRSGDIGTASSFTLFRPTTARTGSFLDILSYGGAAGNDPYMSLQWDSVNTRVRVLNNTVTVVSANGSAPAGEWHTAGATVDDVVNQKILYFDGINVSSDGNVNTRNHSAIGVSRRFDIAAAIMSGQIAVWYIWDRILTANEMLQLYRYPFGPVTAAPRRVGFVAAAPAAGVISPYYYLRRRRVA